MALNSLSDTATSVVRIQVTPSGLLFGRVKRNRRKGSQRSSRLQYALSRVQTSESDVSNQHTKQWNLK
jgi:hypothetical protein